LKTVDYDIKVSGLNTRPGSIPIVEFKEIIEFLIKGCDRVLRLIIEGRRKRGQSKKTGSKFKRRRK
jgi:hypothetical protein